MPQTFKTKQKMKKQNLFNVLASAALIVALAFGVQSCKKDDPDPCEDVTCSGNGTCNDGDCACDDGYIGSNCETEERAQFLGSYSVATGTIVCGVSGSSSIPAGTSVIVSSNSGGIKKIAISIGGALTVIATVDGSSLTIDNQTIGGYVYTGTGSVTSNTLTVSLSEFDSSIPETCVYSFTATK